MITAGIIELIRKKTSNTQYNSACADDDTIMYTTDMSIFWQVPQYCLVGMSEVLGSITGLEFFYSQAPTNTRSVIMALFHLTTGLGSWMTSVLIALVNVNKNNEWITDNLNDGHLDWYFFVIGVANFLVLCLFMVTANRYQYQNQDENVKMIEQIIESENEGGPNNSTYSTPHSNIKLESKSYEHT